MCTIIYCMTISQISRSIIIEGVKLSILVYTIIYYIVFLVLGSSVLLTVRRALPSASMVFMHARDDWIVDWEW